MPIPIAIPIPIPLIEAIAVAKVLLPLNSAPLDCAVPFALQRLSSWKGGKGAVVSRGGGGYLGAVWGPVPREVGICGPGRGSPLCAVRRGVLRGLTHKIKPHYGTAAIRGHAAAQEARAPTGLRPDCTSLDKRNRPSTAPTGKCVLAGQMRGGVN